MGDYDASAGQWQDERLHQDFGVQQDTGKHMPQFSQSQAPFRNQFDYAIPSQRHPTSQSPGQYGLNAFDMAGMDGALSQGGSMDMPQRAQYDPDAASGFSPASVYQMHHAAQYAPQQSSAQAQPAVAPQYHPVQMQPPMAHQHPGLTIQPQAHFPRMDMYAYGMGAHQYSPVDPRFAPQALPLGVPMPGEMTQFPRRTSEPVPSFPRGPPRKPKQSGHALWVGNLPPAATVTDLKDHFSRDATKDIESLFLISKSNCAFVNYRTEAACVAAMNRFHDSRFHGVRLVCRLRRASTSSLNPSSPTVSDVTGVSPKDLPDSLGTMEVGDASRPVIVGQTRAEQGAEVLEDGEANVDATTLAQKVPEKFFVVKSLTVQDLEASVRNGIWATQSHNEVVLNRAFQQAEAVYLVFSANKSGEYFGYARMASPISGDPVSLGASAETDEAKLAGTPQSIPTPATETAPKGRIIDDSARGTIFWEAILSDNEVESTTKDGCEGGGANGQNWGRQFKIEWMSTSRLPFFRTRGLRNPWNANREVKIARDGTELEPSVGQRLVQMFHRSAPTQAGLGMPGMGMSYRG